MARGVLGWLHGAVFLAAAACSGAIAPGIPLDGGSARDAAGGGNDSGSSSGSNDSGSGGLADSGGAGGDSGASGVDASDTDAACTALTAALCSKLQSCAPFLITIVYGTAATCIDRARLSCPSLFGASGTGVTAGSAMACAQGYMAVGCEDLLANKPPSACAFQGSMVAGAVCGEDSQCSPDAYCTFSAGQGCGVCSPRLSEGDTCGADGNCQPGLICAKQNNAATGNCVNPGVQGAPCDGAHPCLRTLACAADGTCGPALGAGAPCTVQNCDELHGLYCNPLRQVCARLQTATPGGPCGLSFVDGSFTVCTASAMCKTAAGSMSGTCEATAPEGAACDATGGPPCLAPAVCANGVCTLPNASSCH
jgi:hypothetical protein